MLSSSVVVFERDDGVPRPSARVAAHALATVETHDLPPIAGYFDGADLALRREAGALDDAGLAAARAEREHERQAWILRLRDEGLLGEEAGNEALAIALHAFLARTPALLAGVALDDLAGERAPVNLPGISVARHRSWSRRMQRPLDAIAASPLARAILGAFAERARSGARSAAESRALDCAS
jgi:4-alpha-glucanotransferase